MRKVYKRYLMRCGHMVEEVKGEHPECKRCKCTRIKMKINSVFDGLEGRKAFCKHKSVKSRWDLPGFIYQPDEDFDLYLFGK